MKLDHKGLTLIELMIVVVIIGILASIGIGVTLNLRERGFQKTMESDLSMAYKAALSFHMENPLGEVEEDDLVNNGYRKSDGIKLIIEDGTLESLKITATHPNVLGIYQVDNTGTISKQ